MLIGQLKFLEKNNVFFTVPHDHVHLGANSLERVEFEPYCEIRGGRFAVGRIGAFSYLGGGGTILRTVSSIGRFCAIAPGVHIGAMEHPTDFLSSHMLFQGNWRKNRQPFADFYESNPYIKKGADIFNQHYSDTAVSTKIGNDVWIGEGAFIRRGVSIGDGAIVAARSVVVRDVPCYCIVGGAPARVLRPRFDMAIIERLLKSKWWEYGLSAVSHADITEPKAALESIEEKISSGVAKLWHPDICVALPDKSVSKIAWYQKLSESRAIG